MPSARKEFRDILTAHSPENIGSDLKITVKNPENLPLRESLEGDPEHIFVILAGTSESGKSYFGDHFYKSGTGNRLKFYKLLRLTDGYNAWIKDCGVEKPDPFIYAQYLEDKEEEKRLAFKKVLDQICEIESESRCRVSSLETIKHPWILEYFKKIPNSISINLFIDAPLEKRVERESRKTGTPIDQIKDRMLAKDLEKKDFGNEKVLEESDLVIINGGSLQEYQSFIESFESYCASFSNSTTAITIDNTITDIGQLFPKQLENLETEEALKHKFGFIMLKPDAVEFGVKEFLIDHIIKVLKKKKVFLRGIVNIPPISEHRTANLYPDVNDNYFRAYAESYAENDKFVLVFESSDIGIDIWAEMLKLRGTIGNGTSIEDSIRSIIPLPGQEEKFYEIRDRIKSGILTHEDYKHMAKNLVHVPDNIAEFAGVLSIIPEEERSTIFGNSRAKNLSHLVLPYLKGRKKDD